MPSESLCWQYLQGPYLPGFPVGGLQRGKATAQPAWQRNPDASFFVNMGDLLDNGEDNSQWNAWFGVVEPMAEKIPVAPLMGNHETYDLNWKG